MLVTEDDEQSLSVISMDHFNHEFTHVEWLRHDLIFYLRFLEMRRTYVEAVICPDIDLIVKHLANGSALKAQVAMLETVVCVQRTPTPSTDTR